jgi:hypothetical protein
MNTFKLHGNTLIPIYHSTRCHNLEDQHMSLQRCEMSYIKKKEKILKKDSAPWSWLTLRSFVSKPTRGQRACSGPG